jgi:hypothetical protein
MYTAPAYTGALSIALTIVLLFTMFKERYAGIVPQATKAGAAGVVCAVGSRVVDPYFVLPKFKWLPVCVCLFVWFVQAVIGINIET